MAGATLVRRALLVTALLTAVLGVSGGLARLGVGTAPASAVAWHGALMVCGFFGTLIALERAVALGRPWAFAGPLAGAAGAVAMLLGARDLAAAAWLVSPLALVLASIAIARRQPALHTALMVVASCFLAAGNVAFAAGSANGMLEPWFAFIVLTVAAERIEFARLTGRRRGMAAMRAVVCLMVASVVTSAFDAEAAGLAFGASIAALGAWLLRFDIARRTWHAGGFARFAATALLSGYAWLIAGGLAWIAWVEGAPVGDLALHALALGFAASMILAHAPIVVPAVARLRLPYTAAFYLPLALLHGSLLMRAGSVVARLPLSVPGAANAVALGAFVIVVATAARPRGRPC